MTSEVGDDVAAKVLTFSLDTRGERRKGSVSFPLSSPADEASVRFRRLRRADCGADVVIVMLRVVAVGPEFCSTGISGVWGLLAE